MAETKISMKSAHRNRSHAILCALGDEHRWKEYMQLFWENGALPSDFPEGEERDLFDAIYQQYSTGHEIVNTADLSGESIKLLMFLRGSTSPEELNNRNFNDNVGLLIQFGQQVHAIQRMEQARLRIDNINPAAMDEVMTLADDLQDIVARRSGMIDVSGAGPIISGARNRFKATGGIAVPTGIESFDVASQGGLRALQLLGLIGRFKSRKTTVWMNTLIKQVRYSIAEETAVLRVLDLLDRKPDLSRKGWDEIAYEINLFDKEKNKPYDSYQRHIETGMAMWEQNIDYKPRGIVFLSIEKSAEEVYDHLIAMLAIDHLMKATHITKGLHDQGVAPSIMQKIGKPDPMHGYMLCADAPWNRYDVGSFISRSIIHEQADYEKSWILRSIAVNLAIDEIERKWGRRVRVYDATPQRGNLGTVESLLRTMTQDSRQYADYPVSNVGIDYLQMIYITGDEVKDGQRLAQELPLWTKRFNTSVTALIQRNNEGSKNDRGTGVSIDPSARGGTALVAMLDAGVIVYGPINPTIKDNKDDEGNDFDSGHVMGRKHDPFCIYHKVWGGREIDAGKTVVPMPIHPMTGRQLELWQKNGEHWRKLNSIEGRLRFEYPGLNL